MLLHRQYHFVRQPLHLAAPTVIPVGESKRGEDAVIRMSENEWWRMLFSIKQVTIEMKKLLKKRREVEKRDREKREENKV